MLKLTTLEGPKKACVANQINILFQHSRGIWYIDNGCSRYMIGEKSNLVNIQAVNEPNVVFGGNEKYGQIKGIGKVHISF